MLHEAKGTSIKELLSHFPDVVSRKEARIFVFLGLSSSEANKSPLPLAATKCHILIFYFLLPNFAMCLGQ